MKVQEFFKSFKVERCLEKEGAYACEDCGLHNNCGKYFFGVPTAA